MSGGKFITFEGGEGAGKSTQIAALASALRARGIDAMTTREPGGSPAAELIRGLFVRGEPDLWGAVSETLLVSAARREHLRRTIWPAIEEGRWVLCDRFYDSTVAYQGYAGGVPLDELAWIYRFVAGDFAPDLTLIFDLPVEQGLRRALARRGEEDRFERMDRSFHDKLRNGYLTIARENPDRCILIDASGEIEDVTSAIMRAVEHRFGLK